MGGGTTIALVGEAELPVDVGAPVAADWQPATTATTRKTDAQVRMLRNEGIKVAVIRTPASNHSTGPPPP